MKRKILILILAYNNAAFINSSINTLNEIDNTDVLIVDDGSTDLTYETIQEHRRINYIKHEENLGYGASFSTGLKYAKDLDYDVLITLDPENTNFTDEIPQIMDHINYGYDIVSCSRILENYNHSEIPEKYINTTTEISQLLMNETDFNLTDPLSGIKAYQLKSINQMELTEFGHGLLLQMWIQAAFFGLTMIELPTTSGNSFGKELDLYDDPSGFFLSIIESEKYLYQKGTIN